VSYASAVRAVSATATCAALTAQGSKPGRTTLPHIERQRRDGNGGRRRGCGVLQETGARRQQIEQQSHAGPFAGPKPERMTVPCGASRSNRRAHRRRLGWARGFLPSWSYEFNSCCWSRPPTVVLRLMSFDTRQSVDCSSGPAESLARTPRRLLSVRRADSRGQKPVPEPTIHEKEDDHDTPGRRQAHVAHGCLGNVGHSSSYLVPLAVQGRRASRLSGWPSCPVSQRGRRRLARATSRQALLGVSLLSK